MGQLRVTHLRHTGTGPACEFSASCRQQYIFLEEPLHPGRIAELPSEIDVLVIDVDTAEDLEQSLAELTNCPSPMTLLVVPPPLIERAYELAAPLSFREILIHPRDEILRQILPQLLERAGTQAVKERMTSFLPRRQEMRLHDIKVRCDDLEELARTDHLTGLGNRRAFEEDLTRLAREGGRLGLLLADIDGFKGLNDRHGHAVGDQALTLVAEVFQATTRETDSVYRIGGDEFVVLCPGQDPGGASVLSDRLRDALARRPVDGTRIEVSVSMGHTWVELAPGSRVSLSNLLEAADQRLYQEKSVRVG